MEIYKGFQFDCIILFAIAFLVAFFVTPIIRKIAFKIGAVDVPRDERRMHVKPVARLGGLAIYIGFLVSILYYCINNFIDTGSFRLDLRFQGLIAGSLIIIIIGAIDDVKSLKPWVKLLFQVGAALIVAMSGTRIEEVTNPFSPIGMTFLGVLSIPLTVAWIVGITNAINLIDGLDGLAAGVSSIALFSLLFISISENQVGVVYVIAALAGATLGFLPFNFNPAKIFMGDSGSYFLGFSLASVSVAGMMKSYATIAIAVPLLVLALPIFDTAFAILRRLFRGKPIMEADRGHLHHRLIDMGFTQRQTVIVLYIVSGFLGICAIELATKGVFKAIILLFSVAVFVVAGAKYVEDMNSEKKQEDTGDNTGK